MGATNTSYHNNTTVNQIHCQRWLSGRHKERPWSNRLTCRKTCSKRPSIALLRRWKNTTLKKTLQRSSRRTLTRNTTQHGTALLGVTLGATSLTRRNTLSTFTWDKSPFFSSNRAKSKKNTGGGQATTNNRGTLFVYTGDIVPFPF